MLIHGIFYVAVWIHGNGNPTYDPEGVLLRHNLVAWGCPGDECSEKQKRMLRVNMYGFTALFLVLTMTGFAFSWVRRNRFEWFYYIHHLFIFVLLFTCLHYSGSIVYLIPGFALYSIDKLLGLIAYRKAGNINAKMVSRDVLEVSVKLGAGVTYQACQEVFLNVTFVSFLEWHPFYLTSSPNADGNNIHFHIKESGKWTNEVISDIIKNPLWVCLDAFYGHDSKLALEYKHAAVFVGGGIGVTPMLSVALYIFRNNTIPITFIWVVRTIEEFNISH